MSNWRIPPDTLMDELFARYVVETASERDPGTNDLYLTTYGGTTSRRSSRGLAESRLARAANYIRSRLGSVRKGTIDKELSALRGFLRWCEEQGYVEVAPVVPKPPPKALGTRYRLRRRDKPTEITVEEARAIIDRLPNYSASRRVPRFLVRNRFILAFETGLRPETLDLLRVPEHYVPGSATLTIVDAIDKGRLGRTLPLSQEACAALDASCPESGPIFGRHDYRDQLRKAAKTVLDEQRVKTLAPYDFRHLRLTQLAEAGNLLGVSFLAGHKRATTTDRYLRPSRRAGERALAAVGPTGFTPPRSSTIGQQPVGQFDRAPGNCPTACWTIRQPR